MSTIRPHLPKMLIRAESPNDSALDVTRTFKTDGTVPNEESLISFGENLLQLLIPETGAGTRAAFLR